MTQENTTLKLNITAPVEFEDGTHNGTIVRVERRTQPYDYTDLVIKEDETGFELKYGCPTNGSKNSKLVRTLEQLGVACVEGETIDVHSIVGMRVTFMTKNKTSDAGTFARITADTIMPAKD